MMLFVTLHFKKPPICDCIRVLISHKGRGGNEMARYLKHATQVTEIYVVEYGIH